MQFEFYSVFNGYVLKYHWLLYGEWIMRKLEWETKDIEKAMAAVHPRGLLQAA